MTKPNVPNWTSESVEALRRNWQTSTPEQLSATLNRTWHAIRCKAKRLGLPPKGASAVASGPPTTPNEESVTVTEQGVTGERSALITTADRIETPEQAMAKAGLSLDDWVVVSMKLKNYEALSKDAEGEAVVTPMTSIALTLAPKTAWTSKEFLEEVKTELRKAAGGATKKRRATAPKGNKSGILAEVSVMDHHFGKLCWAPETGEDYDLKIAEDRYREAMAGLLAICRRNRPERILFPLGNDFYHVDKGDNTTTRGTRVDADGRWQKAYRIGLRCVRDAIEEAKGIAPVSAVIVPGNHDTEKAFTMGVALEGIYEYDSLVEIDNAPNPKKSFVWGGNFLGFYHGYESMSTVKERQVIDALASQNPEAWARARWRELHLGHLHSEREDVWKFRKSEELDMIIVRRLPSLCGTDYWHHCNGYRSLKAAELHMFCKSSGRAAVFTHTPHEFNL